MKNNYWDDYSGIDEYSGPLQNISGSDCIGDTPYPIQTNADYYPLMSPDIKSPFVVFTQPQMDDNITEFSLDINVVFNKQMNSSVIPTLTQTSGDNLSYHNP